MSERSWGFRTRALHAGGTPDQATGARAVPIYQTTSFVFEDASDAANLFALQKYGNIYSRIGNPTVSAFEERMASLEGGIGGVATASGQAAEFLTFSALAEAGEHIVSASGLYGGTVTQLDGTLRRFGVDTTFVAGSADARSPAEAASGSAGARSPAEAASGSADARSPAEAAGAALDDYAAAITDKTKLIYTEIIGNPSGGIADVSALADLAHAHDIPLVVDATLATPYLCRPLEHGADIVLHSATKFLGGHGTTLGGIVVESGRFNWGNGRFPRMTETVPSYGGLRYWENFGEYAFCTRLRAEQLRDIGPVLSPHSAFLLLQGVETLPQRMDGHVRNAQAVAEFLENDSRVEWVAYAGLPSHPHHALAKRYLPEGPGAVFSFGLRGGREAGEKFVESVELLSHLANVGDARTLVIHPASTTHQQLSDEQLRAGGVGPDLIRLSVGLEDVEDILWDIDRALTKAVGA